MTTSTDRCTADASNGLRCRNRAVVDGLCSVHAGRVDMGELSKKGVRARLARKDRGDGKTRVREALRRAIESRPDEVAERLLSTTRGVELGWELAYEESAAEGEQRQWAEAPPDPQRL